MNPTNNSNRSRAPTAVVVTEAASSSTGGPGDGGEPLSDDDDDDIGSSSESNVGMDDDDEDGGYVTAVAGSSADLASQLASAGTTGMAAAAAITSTKKRKRSHAFETNPSIRKRQQTRLLRKLRHNIEEYSLRVGQQAVVVVACPGSKHQNNFRAFGAKPLEDVVKNLRTVVMTELENSLARQAPPPLHHDDPSLHELPPLVIDGIPTPVEKMTQAQLRAFIPLMLKYSTGRGKPGWGKESTKPAWWPPGVPWANVRMDARREDDKQRVSWTHALRQIVLNCYRYHGREDLMPTFAEGEEEAAAADNEQMRPQAASPQQQQQPTVLQTISNSDGSVSIIHVDPNNPVITLPDGSQAHVAHFEPGQPGVHTLAEVASAASEQREQQEAAAAAAAAAANEVNGTEVVEAGGGGTILIAGEDGQAYPVTLAGGGGLVSVPAGGSVYQIVQGGGGGDTVHVINGNQLQAVNGQLVVKAEPTSRITTEESQPANQRGLTITPVSRPQQTVAVQGQVIQIVQGANATHQVTTTERKPIILSAARTAAPKASSSATSSTSS